MATGAPRGFGVGVGRGIDGARGAPMAGSGAGVGFRSPGGGGGFAIFGGGGGGGFGAGGGSLQPLSITEGALLGASSGGTWDSAPSEAGGSEIGMSSSST